MKGDAKGKGKGKGKDKGTDKDRGIDLAIQAIQRQFGEGSIMRLAGDDSTPVEVPTISTGSIGLDIALGVGGLPKGRIIEIYGPESSGKTTLALEAVAQCHKEGGNAAFIDAEHALDVNYARRLGVKTDELLVSQPDYGEQALEIADMLVKSGAVDIIVVDSVAALVPKAEIEGDMGDSHMGLQARLMSQALRKLTASVSKSNTVLVFINQIRHKIGVMFGNPETTTGGNALKFYASVRLEIRKIANIKKDNVLLGSRVRVKAVKNKMAPPFREAEFDIVFGTGINKVGDLLDTAETVDIVNKSGAWYSLGDMRLGQGRDNSIAFIEDNPDVLTQIATAVKAHFGLVVPAVDDEEDKA